MLENVANPVLKRCPNRKRTIGSGHLLTSETESETDTSPTHSKYINSALIRKVSHDPTFGVYQNDTNGSFKIGRSCFKYNDKYAFEGRKRYNSIPVSITNPITT